MIKRTFILACLALLAFFPASPAHAQATTNNNPGNPLPQGQADDLETTAQNLESSASAAYQFQNEGIFGCNQIGGVNMSAGTMAAIGGVYVPVNDAAVTLNTGILVYKECVLRPLQNRLKESATSALLKQNVIGIETGRSGNKRYVVKIGSEELAVSDRKALEFLTNGLSKVRPELRQDTQRALARYYQRETRGQGDAGCAYVGDLRAGITDPVNTPFDFANFSALGYSDCNPWFEYAEEKVALEADIAGALECQRRIWEWGRGYYSLSEDGDDPCEADVMTPSSVVQESFQAMLNSPLNQLESANDIGQMIGALFAGVTTQALNDSRGLAGFRQSAGGQPSYLDQIAKESSQGVVGAAVNAALTILNQSRQVEGSYLTSMNGIASKLTQTINDLRNVERQCWAIVVPKAQEYAAIGPCEITDPTTAPPTQTCRPFALDPLKIAASTSSLAFSQQVIDSQIRPLSEVAVTNVAAAQKAVQMIEQLIASVTNTASLNAQRLALQQLDSLVSQKLLHTQYDAQRAGQQKQDVDGAMETLKSDTAKAWGDSPDPAVGWCNINNANIPRLWAEKWKK